MTTPYGFGQRSRAHAARLAARPGITDHAIPGRGRVTVTLTPDLSQFQAALEAFARSARVLSLRFKGRHALADVVQYQPGRQAVRAGMGDVLHWLGECSCRPEEPGRCGYIACRACGRIRQINAWCSCPEEQRRADEMGAWWDSYVTGRPLAGGEPR